MTPAHVKSARRALGMTTSKLGLALHMASDEGRSVRNWGSGRNPRARARARDRASLPRRWTHGRVGFLEMKRPGGVVSGDQERIHRALAARGCCVGFAASLDEARSVADALAVLL